MPKFKEALATPQSYQFKEYVASFKCLIARFFNKILACISFFLLLKRIRTLSAIVRRLLVDPDGFPCQPAAQSVLCRNFLSMLDMAVQYAQP